MNRSQRLDPEFVRAALIGFEQERMKIEAKMEELRRALGAAGAAKEYSASSRSSEGSGRHPLSAEARQRIAAAQRRRWAAYKKQKAKTAA